MKLLFREAVDSLDLLLLPQLNAVVGCLAAAAFAVLARRIGAPVERALIGIASISLEKELYILTPANPAVGTPVVGQNVLPVIA